MFHNAKTVFFEHCRHIVRLRFNRFHFIQNRTVGNGTRIFNDDGTVIHFNNFAVFVNPETGGGNARSFDNLTVNHFDGRHIAGFVDTETGRSRTGSFDNLGFDHFGLRNADPTFVHAVTAGNAAGIFQNFNFSAELAFDRIHFPLQINQSGTLSLQFFRRNPLRQLIFKPRQIAQIVNRIGKGALDQNHFAVIFTVFDFAVADALSFPQHVGFGQIHQAPGYRHFGRTDSLVGFFGFVPIVFVAKIHIVVGNFRRQNIFRQRAVFSQTQIIRRFDDVVAIGNHIIENFDKVHVFFQNASFVQDGVFTVAAATENAKTVFAELARIIAGAHAVFNAKIDPFQF